MGFKLPPENHPTRELLGDMKTLVTQLDPTNIGKLPMLRQALAQAASAFDAAPNGEIRRINYVVLRGTGERHLISIGPKGAWLTLWNFGDGR